MNRSHELRAVAQSGRALEWGSRGRWFESNQPDKAPEMVFGGLSFWLRGSARRAFKERIRKNFTTDSKKNLHF